MFPLTGVLTDHTPHTLYTLADIVGRLRLSETAARRFVETPGFPTPILTTGGSLRRRRLWSAVSVEAFIALRESGR